MKGEEKEIFHSKLNKISYGFGSLSREFAQMAFNVLVFFYYETELGLDVLLIGLGLVIFAIYNAINDPIIGYLTNRPFSFTKKWGRRMPWLLIGGIPLGFSYFLVFTPPTTDPIGGAWILFGWLVFTTCLFDTLHTLFFVNFQSLFPDKFRSVKERRTATGVQIFLGVIGIAIGSILPPLIYKYGDLTSYIVQALVVCFITLISFVFAIPGFREDPKMIDQYLKSVQGVSRRPSFFNTTKNAFKQKAFVAYMILYTMYWVIINSMQSSLPYVVRYSLKMPASATTLIMAGLLVGIMCSIPLWVKLSHKINDNRKIMLIGAVLMGIYAIPLIFLDSYIGIIINVIIWGTAQGAYWVMIFPVMSDVIDESVVLYKKREEGTYIGIQQFFGRMGLIGQILSFTIIHELTGFVEGADTQAPLAIWGIHIHLALVPMIAILFGAFAFWRLFDLKPDKVMEHQELIRTLKL